MICEEWKERFDLYKTRLHEEQPILIFTIHQGQSKTLTASFSLLDNHGRKVQKFDWEYVCIDQWMMTKIINWNTLDFRMEKFAVVGEEVQGVVLCDKNGLLLTSMNGIA